MSKELSSREQIMKDAVASRAAQVEKEAGTAMPEVQLTEAPPVVEFEPDPSLAPKSETPPEPTPAPQPTPEPTPQPEPTPAPAETIEVRIDHETLTVPKADVDALGGVAAYQMTKAAEKRLATASEALARAKAAEQQWRQPAPVQTPPAPVLSEDDKLRAVSNSIRFGSEEEALAAIKELRGQRQNPQELMQQIIPAVRTQISAEQAAEKFKDEFQDIANDPDLAQLAVSRAHARLSAGEQVTDWLTFYRSIGTPLREKFGKPAIDLNKRNEMKAQLTVVPTASGKPPTPVETPVKSGSDIVREMRKARGQPI